MISARSISRSIRRMKVGRVFNPAKLGRVFDLRRFRFIASGRLKKPSYHAARLLMLLVLLTSTIGCFGRFPITRSAYRFNRDISKNEFIQTLTFWGMLITFYPYGLIGDLVFLNPVEFWSGESLDIAEDKHTSSNNDVESVPSQSASIAGTGALIVTQ